MNSTGSDGVQANATKKTYLDGLIYRLLMPPPAMTERELRKLHSEAAEMLNLLSRNAGVRGAAPGHVWNDYGKKNGRNWSWCSRCHAGAYAGEEPEGPCGVSACAQPINRVSHADDGK